MNGDDIGRIPSTTGVPLVKREREKPENSRDEDHEEPEKPAEPEDEIVLSMTGEINGFDHPDTPDAFYMALDALQDLLMQHKDNYPMMEYQALLDQLAFLQSHGVARVYWPPSLSLQDAVTQAGRSITLPAV